MIKVKNLQKFYNRGRQNEIHVINDISLELPDKGLVILLGPSGSGKTTLLNVLGGLDKVQSGVIHYGDTEMHKYKSSVWDKIRNKDVGYIFQNYNLLEDLTVYENISLTLNMIGIYEKEEIDHRIDYILDHMGMLNYRKRRAAQLSGGQQQRVAIARALAKNPHVIIADEPTGNLDSKNTQDIMNIIKAISRTKLVVLVTHEIALAEYYGDRIIRLKDGRIISDEVNLSTGSLNMRHETDIYLGDMRAMKLEDGFEIYSDEPLQDDVNVRLIVKNKTLYVDVKSEHYRKLQLLEENSEIQIHEGSYKAISREELTVDDFDISDVIRPGPDAQHKHSVIRFKDSLRIAWNRMKNSNIMGRVFYVTFALIAGLISLAVGMGNSYITFEEADYLFDSRQLIVADRGLFDYDDFQALEANPSIAHIRNYEQQSIQFHLPTVFQSSSNMNSFSAMAEDINLLDESNLLIGRAPETPYEFVVDAVIARQMINDSRNRYVGITTYEDLIELEFYATIPGVIDDYTFAFTMVGIVDEGTPLMYMNEDLIYMIQNQVGLYEFFRDDITLERGELPADHFEMLVPHSELLPDPLSNITALLLEQTFTASGSFSIDGQTNVPNLLVKRNDIKEAYFNSNNAEPSSQVAIIANDIEDALQLLETNNFVAVSYLESEREAFQQQRIEDGIGMLTFVVVVLFATAISYFFVIRSSLLARIYEVSVYRALGVSKWDIHKLFAVETLLVTTLTSLSGYFIATYLLWRMQLTIEDFATFITITPLSIITGVVIVYLVNLVSGYLPVANLLRRTPAEILSKYDF
jgi:ABC-type lipoprotein export system ATPase subunit